MKAPRKQAKGFTIIELMVALTIAATMMAFAIPAFNDFTTQRQMAANVNSMIGAINFARSEAARLGGTVTVQSADASSAGNEWGEGFCIQVGDPGNCANPLRDFTIEGEVTFNALGGLNGIDSLSFNSRGLMIGGMVGSIQLCGQDTDDDPGRTININAIGRANIVDLTCF